MPNLHWAEIDAGKFSDYSLNPGHPQNRGKAEGWRAMGYDVDDKEARRDAAKDLTELLRSGLLGDGRVTKSDQSDYGPRYTVVNGFIGRNGAHGTLVTCWQVENRDNRPCPRLVTTWMQPHQDKGHKR